MIKPISITILFGLACLVSISGFNTAGSEPQKPSQPAVTPEVEGFETLGLIRPDNIAKLEKNADLVIIAIPHRTIITGKTTNLKVSIGFDATEQELKTEFITIAILKGKVDKRFDVFHHRVIDCKEIDLGGAPRYAEFRLNRLAMEVKDLKTKQVNHVVLDPPAYLLYLVKNPNAKEYRLVSHWQTEEDSVFELTVPWSHRINPAKLVK